MDTNKQLLFKSLTEKITCVSIGNFVFPQLLEGGTASALATVSFSRLIEPKICCKRLKVLQQQWIGPNPMNVNFCRYITSKSKLIDRDRKDLSLSPSLAPLAEANKVSRLKVPIKNPSLVNNQHEQEKQV